MEAHQRGCCHTNAALDVVIWLYKGWGGPHAQFCWLDPLADQKADAWAEERVAKEERRLDPRSRHSTLKFAPDGCV